MDKEDPYRAADAKSTVIAPVKIGRYLIGKTLGHGSFGKVKQAQHAFTQTQVAFTSCMKKIAIVLL
jgi:serine/threonine protein kinase